MFRSAYYIFLLFSFLITGFIQVPSMSWAQETVTPSGSRHGFLPPRALQQRRENRQERRQDFRSNRQGSGQRNLWNRGGGSRGQKVTVFISWLCKNLQSLN